MTELARLPHHDGSALYVSHQAPQFGDVVSVRLRVPHPPKGTDRVTAVHVRVLRDAEPYFTDARIVREDDVETWWEARITVHNPVTTYRFILEGGPWGYAWVNGTGLHVRDVPDAANFRLVAGSSPPTWSEDAVVYQIFPDRFARSQRAEEREAPEWALPAAWDDPVLLTDPEIGRQLYGGDLDGVVEHLDHLADLGVDVVYLTPVFPGRSNHRYDARTFDEVDPVLGGDGALVRLTRAAHERGMRVMGDFTTNHTGDAHEWFVEALTSADSSTRDHYYWDDEGGYVSWLGVPSLPKLNYDSQALRRRVFDDPQGVVRKWLSEPFELDGWRVDVANMTGRYRDSDHYVSVQREMRAAMDEAHPGALLVAEHCHDISGDVDGLGWHGAMNYSGFTRPVWTWLRDRDRAPSFLGSPLLVPRLGGCEVLETMREFAAQIPWTVLRHSFNLLGSHDTTRIRTLVGDDWRAVVPGAALLFTMPGIPMLTYGDEIGMEGAFGEDGRRPMPWDEADWDGRLLQIYRDLIAARRGSVALRDGGLRWVHAGPDSITFLREAPGQSALVHVARDAHEPAEVDRALVGAAGRSVEALVGSGARVEQDTLTLTATEPGVDILVWATALGA